MSVATAWSSTLGKKLESLCEMERTYGSAQQLAAALDEPQPPPVHEPHPQEQACMRPHRSLMCQLLHEQL